MIPNKYLVLIYKCLLIINIYFCLSIPEIQTYCQNNEIRNPGDYGPLDISKSSTFEFLSEFFNEIFETFPDDQIHLGGDEVALDTCW